jgi:hypothetical protein
VKVSKDYNLKALFPEVAQEWHPTENGDLKPEDVTPYTRRKVWWLCANQHKWEASIGSRTRGTNCPFCYGRYASKEYNLQVINPELAKQWHPTKNGKLTPDQVTPGSDKKVWWICQNGHEWDAVICYRNKSTGCPVCALKKTRQKKRGSVSLKEARPDIADQWHPTKNGELTPEHVSYGSKQKVWWKCEEGHSWKAAVKKRTNGTGCPFCAGHKVSKANNLQAVYPKIAQQWHPTKNGNLTPRKVTPGSKKKVWWKCEKGHEWEAGILNRSHGNGCPYCSRKKASKDYNLTTENPALANQWHPDKNGDLTPDQVTPFSTKRVWWKCDNGHEWATKVGHRNRGRGCPQCYKLRIKANKN